MVSDMFRQEMNEWNKNFTLEMFLSDNKTNIMKESDELIEEDEQEESRVDRKNQKMIICVQERI